MRKYVSPWSTVIALFAVLLATGCSSDMTTSADDAQTYDGETVFRGVFAGQGEVAALFPEMWEHQSLRDRPLTEEEAASAEVLWNEVVTAIGDHDATFFDRFGLAVQSGRHLKVSNALDEAGLMLKVGLSAAFGEDVDKVIDDSASKLEPTGYEGQCFFLAAVIAVVLVGNVAVAVNAVYAGNIVYEVNWFWSRKEIVANKDVQLSRDMAVDMVTTRLRF